MMGDSWPAVKPVDNVADLGSAVISPTGAFPIRSFQTFTLTYTLGKLGLDDTGGIRIVQRLMNDTGTWQTDNPQGMNYVTATASNRVALRLIVDNGFNRPWNRSLRIIVDKGYMQQGDTITIVFGDTSRGGAGLRMPTFCETAHEFRVLVDACATGQHYPINDRPAVQIVPEVACTWRAIIPSLRQVERDFTLAIRGDDLWGNPSDKIGEKLFLSAMGPVKNMPESVDFPLGVRCLHVPNLKTTDEGVIRITVRNQAGNVLMQSNPLVVKNGIYESFWGDLHGQSGETVGINSIDEYFDFGKNLSMLDIMCHQANDFQVSAEFWQKINAVAKSLNEDHKFVAFPGYEWSGNTPTGGDHNVIYFEENRPLHRSSRSIIHTDTMECAYTTQDLFNKLETENCMVFGHVGGRPANIAQADGGDTRTAVEIHSDWGTFEWIVADNFELGYRHGVVANSDGHKGRPGASHPGASVFGAFGGLTCVLSPTLTRADIMEAYRRRHHYATTGGRLSLDVQAQFATPSKIFHRNPNNGNTIHDTDTTAIMGDIVQTIDDTAHITANAHTQSPIISIDVLNAMQVTETYRPYTVQNLGNRFRITFHGAEYRGRGRQTTWAGTVKINNAKIANFKTINKWNHHSCLQQVSDTEVEFNFLTTGNFLGFDVWLDTVENATFVIESTHTNDTIQVDTLNTTSHVIQAGGLDRKVSVTRLPDTLTALSSTTKTPIPISPQGDTPIWIRIATEDGHMAWSSPIYVYK